MKIKFTIVGITSLLLGLASGVTLEEGFRAPPNEAKPHLWWHWMNGNVTKEGITADLESMAEVGIGGAQVFDAGCAIPPGPVAFASPEWYELFAHAGHEAKRLGLELCHANCSGWSSSGGPWITPDKAMKALCVTEEGVTSDGKAVSLTLPRPKGAFYEDIAMLAFPVATTNLFRLDDWRKKAFYGRNNDWTYDVRTPPAGTVVPRASVIRLEKGFDVASGRLAWTPPAPGRWKVLRVGFRSLDVKNHPASEKGVGLEVDKLSEAAVRFHMDQYCAKLVEKLGDAAGKVPYGLNNILVDSYEVGCQNWTQGFEKTFKTACGYDLTPYLPLLACGYAVGSADESERFLEDFRRVVADEFAKNYCGGLAKKCHELGLRLSVEPYGNCPADNLQYGAACDIPTAEFWSHGQHRNADAGNARLAAHVAHANGRRIVAAEAFSADPNAGGRWTTTPFSLKSEGDAVYAAGVNRIVYHRFVHQPWKEPYLPGLTMGRWGIHFERSNTWWYEQKEWLKYQARCQWMLMEGAFCADVLCYYGEGAPNVRSDWYYGIVDPKDIPEGYDYDQCARDAVLGLTVRDGRVVNPSGVSYAVLALPPDETMSLEVIRKLESLADRGATIVGLVKPTRAPGLVGHDADVRAIADRIWGTKIKVTSVDLALKKLKLQPDCLCGTEALPYSWIHRRGTDGSDWYFVATRNAGPLERVTFTFRPDETRVPELWNPETGTIVRARSVGKDWRGRRTVTIDRFPPDGSMFIVFRGQAADVPVAEDWKTRTSVAVNGPWKLAFPSGRKAPAEVTLPALCSWSDHEDPGVRYFSGTATYRIEIPVPEIKPGERLVLDLGDVRHFAQVTANGKTYPTLWRPPYAQDITDALATPQLRNPATSQPLSLSIRVTNLWPNRLIGDERECATDCEWNGDAIKCLPEWVKKGEKSPTGRVTFTTWHHWRATDELLPSGILGPVTIKVLQENP